MVSHRTWIVLTGAFALAAGVFRAVLWGVPVPHVMDEFGYLLTADTFASGHITMPTPQLWQHFETTYINMVPSYASRFPPGQGAFLALGQATFGHPIAGVWISTALACAALCWMLLNYLPRPWALVGTFVVCVRMVAQFWDASYWGGSVAALGGALVFGNLPKWSTGTTFWDGVRVAAGLALIAFTRPLEGLTILVVAAVVARLTLRHQLNWSRTSSIPAVLILAVTFSVMAYYNWRVTGNALKMPYAASLEQYFPVPMSLLMKPGPSPAIRHADIDDCSRGEVRAHAEQKTPRGFFAAATGKLIRVWSFYFGLSLTPAVILLLFSPKDPWTKFALWTCAVSMLLMLHQTWMNSHYTAPFAGLAFVIAAQSLRALSAWRFGIPAVGAILALHLFFLFAPMRSWAGNLHTAWSQPWAEERARMIERLQAQGGRHLILVKYQPSHNSHHQWIYNDADIESSTVVWARDLGEDENRPLLKRFAGRQIWRLEADPEPGRLIRVD